LSFISDRNAALAGTTRKTAFQEEINKPREKESRAISDPAYNVSEISFREVLRGACVLADAYPGGEVKLAEESRRGKGEATGKVWTETISDCF